MGQGLKRKIDSITPTNTNNMIKNWTTIDANHVAANAGFSNTNNNNNNNNNNGGGGSGTGTPDDKTKSNKKNVRKIIKIRH